MPASASLEPIPLGPFSLDIANHRLLRDGVEIKLRPQALAALRVLAENPGRDVDCGLFMRNAWSGTCVSAHTVEVTVAEVKRALGEYSYWITRRPKLGYRLEIPASGELVRSGWHFLSHRTREGLERALACFEEAARINGGDFRAFEGLAQSYLTLGVYGMRAPCLMHLGFLKAHQRAVALVGWTPELRWTHAHALHIFERKFDEAEAGFLQVLREKPTLVPAYARLAMLYVTLERMDEALNVLERGNKVDPLFPLLPATEALVYFCRREFDQALAAGKRSVELHPHLELGRTFYAQALEYAGRVDEALAQYQAARVICPDSPRLKALEATCLARHGRRRKAVQAAEELEQARASEYVDAYYMVPLLDSLGRRGEALAEMERAIAENSTGLFMLYADPNLDPLRHDSRFLCLLNRFREGYTAVFEENLMTPLNSTSMPLP